jgi:stage IV sporulation protein FB
VLRFHVGPFPVTVELMFWLSALLLGMSGGPLEIAIWVAVVFVSVLVHELGHAMVGLWLGGRPEIRLQAFGGVTFPFLRKRPGALLQIALSVAGPLAGLLLGGVAWVALHGLSLSRGGIPGYSLRLIAVTSVRWAALNLLPILPLDGGHVLEAALSGIRKKPSQRLAAIISIAVGGGLALYAFFIEENKFLGVLLALFAAQNFAALGSGPRQSREAPAEPELPGPSPSERADVERLTDVARRSMAAGEESGALAAADLLEASEGAYRQAAGLRIRAGVMLARGQNVDAGLFAGRSFTLYPQADAAVVASRANLRAGDRAAALAWLRRALEAGAPPEAVQADAELGGMVRVAG